MIWSPGNGRKEEEVEREAEKKRLGREKTGHQERQLDTSKVTNQQENSWKEVNRIYDGRELILTASGRWSLLSQI